MKGFICTMMILWKIKNILRIHSIGDLIADLVHALNILSVSDNGELDTEKMFNVISLLWVNNWPQWLGGFLGFYPG